MALENYSLSWEKKIIRAIQKSALYMYEFDVTTGLVGNDIVGEDGENYTKVLGIQAPCMFNDLIIKSHVEELKSSIPGVNTLETLNCGSLMNAYKSGDSCPEVEFIYTETQEHHRLTYYMTENKENGHVMALVVCRNISEMR